MSCDNLQIPRPQSGQCLTTLFGIPYGTAGRTVAGETFSIEAIVLHCYDGTIAELCNEMKCRVRSSVITGSSENSYHYGIGSSGGSGGFLQFVEDNNISWSFGSYKNTSYATVPPPSQSINWPVLQAEHGIAVTPDVFTIDIALAIGDTTPASSLSGCPTCPTSSGLQQHQHEMLVQMLAFLVQEYNIEISTDYIQFHDNISCGESQECLCRDIDELLLEVNHFCPPCIEEAVTAPEALPDDEIQYIYGITEPCCLSSSPGCAVKIPWNACFVGDLAIDGTLDSYILGLAEDPQTGQWCLTRGCLAVVSPLIGCGTTDDPLRIDRCAIEAYIDAEGPLSQVNRVMGTDDNGCWTLESPDSFVDRVICANPENMAAVPEYLLAKTDNTCPEWVTPGQIVEFGLTVEDSDCIDLEFNNGILTIEPIIDPDPSNTLVCQATGLFVPGLNFVSSDCIEFVDNGNDTFQFEPIIAPSPQGDVDENNLFCLPGEGLFVPKLQILDGFTINLGLGGTYDHILSSDIIFSQDPNNIAEADLTPGTGGLLVSFAVANTDCINLDWTNGVLTATPAISIDVGGISNVLQCLGSGLYVPRGGDALVNGPLTGDGSDINPLDIDFTLLSAQDLCDLGGVLPAGVLVNVVGTDGADCLRVQALVDILPTPLTVDDTDCITLDITADVLTAEPIIAPAQGGVDNSLVCIAGQGLYVPEVSTLSVNGTNCIDLDITNDVLTVDVIIDPQLDNQVTCGPNGLYVPPADIVNVQDTDCLNLDLTAGVISGTITFAGTQGGVPNALTCIPGQGLYVSETAGITVLDTSCIDLDLTNGVLTAVPILDPALDNQLVCGGNGLYVPPSVDGISVLDTDCVNLTLTLAGVISANLILAPAQGGIDNALQCIPGQGLYAPLCNFSITDGVNTEIVDCGDTITFVGQNGATAIVGATDEVTIDGHMICANSVPNVAPPYDTDQAWTHYDAATETNYTWNCTTLRWQTVAHEFNGTAPPDAGTCAANLPINGVTEGVWIVGQSTYTIPAGNGIANTDRKYLLTADCEWSFIEGIASDIMIINPLSAPIINVPEGIDFQVPYDQLGGGNQLGIMNAVTSSATIEEDGCYTIEVNTVMEIAVPYQGIIMRTTLYVDGNPVEHVSESGGWAQPNLPPPGESFTHPSSATMTQCFGAGQVVEIYQSIDADGAIGAYDIAIASVKMTRLS